ncbi:glucans biosynthesis glucosyltransferase MdoH [Granulosicoccaceae sp. 1_MG-2023]|nr:glucans biosynthesis glucosyltransferase MdoH [Granulosicoccaceae sp. 1_MG-2023]
MADSRPAQADTQVSQDKVGAAATPPFEHPWRRRAVLRRSVVFLLVMAQTAAAAYVLLAVLPYHGSTWLEKAIVLVAATLFIWISAGFWMALCGFVVRRFGGDKYNPSVRFAQQLSGDSVELTDTAIVFPVYHEDVQRTLAGLRATWLDLTRTGKQAHFTFFVLSDSRDPDIWLQEREACRLLRDELGDGFRLYYRRRILNLNRKTGNIADFLRRWGKHYTYTLVMDADSIMSGDALVRMVRIMQLDPRIGILQSAPALINAVSGYARIQQFGNRLYGALFTEGLAALQMGEAVYWGHNAIIRTAPFMQYCGLPHLPGVGFIKGSILSHDFVEAHCMWKAGYEVWLDPRIEGSYEESPPTLDDELERDRRWAKGNLQHLYFLFGSKVSLAHRTAFANGIMAYCASALWFIYLVLITVELAQFVLFPIDYFPEPYSLFPTWPQWDPTWAVTLALSTLFLLFAPKLLAMLEVLFSTRRRRAYGGAVAVISGVVLEMLVSVLLAPIRMLAHTQYVLGTLFNLSISWAGQNRTREISWRDALLNHLPGAVLAACWAGFAYWLQPMFFYWSLPIAIPLLLAAPVSVWLSSFRTGRDMREREILLTPEEVSPPAVSADLHNAPSLVAATALTAFERAVVHPRVNGFHVAQAYRRQDTPQRCRQRRMLVRRCLRHGAAALTLKDRAWLVDDGKALSDLHRAVWAADEESVWGRCVDRLCREIRRA